MPRFSLFLSPSELFFFQFCSLFCTRDSQGKDCPAVAFLFYVFFSFFLNTSRRCREHSTKKGKEKKKKRRKKRKRKKHAFIVRVSSFLGFSLVQRERFGGQFRWCACRLLAENLYRWPGRTEWGRKQLILQASPPSRRNTQQTDSCMRHVRILQRCKRMQIL